MKLKHSPPSGFLGEGDVYPFLESSPDGCVEIPRDIRGAEDQDTIVVDAHSLHLNQELCLDSSSSVVFRVGASAAERVNLVDEDDGRFTGSGKYKQTLDKSFAFSEPLADEIG